MPNAQVVTMPVKLSLKLMPIICLNGMYPKRKFSSDIIYKINCTFLIVLPIYAQSSGAGRIIDGGVLISFNPFSAFIVEERKLNVYLDAVAGNLFLISFKLFHGPFTLILRQAIHPIALK